MAQKKNFLLRIDSDLWDELQSWAADELRSINGQIEYLMKQAVKTRRKKFSLDSHKEEIVNSPRKDT